jgi:hypothetical protein
MTLVGVVTGPPLKRVGSHTVRVPEPKVPLPPPIGKGFMKGLGVLAGLAIAGGGFFAPWTIGLLIIAAGLIVVILVARS